MSFKQQLAQPRLGEWENYNEYKNFELTYEIKTDPETQKKQKIRKQLRKYI